MLSELDEDGLHEIEVIDNDNPTKFKPVILKNVCSKTYLDMFMHMLPKSDTWQNKEEHNVNYKKINLQKLNIVTHGKYDNELLGGIATGLLAQIYDAGGKEYLTPEMHFVYKCKN